jgi:hypothetical protein
MRYRKYILRNWFLFAFLIFPFFLKAQGDVINNVKTAIKTGSSKELIKYLGSSVELNLEGEKTTYSKTQAEFVLKDFFRKYVPADFQYIHQGASKEGFKYAIGKYTFENGSFRVWILFKHKDGVYYADTMDFTRE